MEKPAAPGPLLQMAIEPKSRADQEKLHIALSQLTAEDTSFHVKTDEESGQTIIAHIGEHDLDIIIDRLRREFMINVNVGAPQVAYRETITRTHGQDFTHKKQFGGTGQFARVKIVFEPSSYDPDLRWRPVSSVVRFRTNTSPASKRGCAALCRQGRSRAFR